MFGMKRKAEHRETEFAGAINREPTTRRGSSPRPPIAPEFPARANQTHTPNPSFIGADLTVTGKLSSKGDLHIDGEVQGDIHCKSIVIGESAEIQGAIVAEDVKVDGCVIGTIYSSRITLKSSCHVEGELYHQSLLIEKGTYFEGRSRRSDDPIADFNKRETLLKKGAPAPIPKELGTTSTGPVRV